MNDSTKLIKSNEYHDVIKGKRLKTVNPPVYNGSTVLLEKYEDMVLARSGKYDGIYYGTNRLPTQRAFEEALRELEGGQLTRAFQSGISAIINTLFAFTESGDHIILCENVYGPTARFCNKILSGYNIEATFAPASAGTNIAEHIRKNTKLIFLESPGSNTFEIQDIPAIIAIARERNVITALDNTWATPLYLKPLQLGVDISIQSVSKYISGHSDVLLGAVTVNEKYSDKFDNFYDTMEIFAPPYDCYLALRGLKTLPLRLKQHEISAIKVARWLENIDLVDKVIHPALQTHPQHHIWRRDFAGSSGLFAFTCKEDYSEEKIASFINSLDLFGIGFSWGGFKSLITAGKYKRFFGSEYSGKTVIRLNIGLEDSNDLIKDLQKGLQGLE
jgi:cysteine-S-conjugate beta-lyase